MKTPREYAQEALINWRLSDETKISQDGVIVIASEAVTKALADRDAERDKHDQNWMTRHDDAQAKHAERIERLRDVLTIAEYEWCQACKRKPSSATGHASDCIVAAALAVLTCPKCKHIGEHGAECQWL